MVTENMSYGGGNKMKISILGDSCTDLTPALARVLGVTKTMVGNWEQGRTSPDLEYLIMYSRITDIDLEKLLF